MDEEQLSYLVALSTVGGLGPARLKLLLNYFGKPKNIWQANRQQLADLKLPQNVISALFLTKEKLNPPAYFSLLSKQNIQIITLFDQTYPPLLKEIPDPPVVLYVKGDFAAGDKKAIAVVGSRKMTAYGRQVTEQLVAGLVQAGLTIVSGLARGIDGAAHKAAMEAGGRTIAVLGGGLNRIYPPEHKKLAEEIVQKHGVVVSEFVPDQPALPGNFPARNRIIAGLSRGVVVTEAAEDSGSLITAKLALDQGREVFAVPGPITSPLSRGPLDLIKMGAKLVSGVEDILDEFGFVAKKNASGQKTEADSPQERLILSLLENEAKYIDVLTRESGLTSAQVGSLLAMMELKGLVKRLGTGHYQMC